MSLLLAAVLLFFFLFGMKDLTFLIVVVGSGKIESSRQLLLSFSSRKANKVVASPSFSPSFRWFGDGSGGGGWGDTLEEDLEV